MWVVGMRPTGKILKLQRTEVGHSKVKCSCRVFILGWLHPAGLFQDWYWGCTVLGPLVWAQAPRPFPGPLVNMGCAGRAVLESGLCMASVGFCFAHSLAQISYLP